MTRPLDDTHDPGLRSWVTSANDPAGDFPIQNLPLGVFRRGRSDVPRLGVAIGDQVLDLRRCGELRLLDGPPEIVATAREASSLNRLLALGPEAHGSLRCAVSTVLRADGSRAEPSALVPLADAELRLPAEVGDYTDFYASIVHARNVGRLFRPDHPLPPSYRHVPLAYHGRSSSLVVSGVPVRRPCGQRPPAGGERPSFGPTERLDYELELGAWVGAGSRPGQPVSIDDAERHLGGFCLVNDWSARDLQAWEAQPLGPFLSKSFATSVSPWMVTLDALAPFRCAAARPAGDPPPLPHLASARNDALGGLDVTVEAWLESAEMRRRGIGAVRLSRARFREMYWTVGQMVAHHTSNGCPLRPGDLLASGTVSGPEDDAAGCLLERAATGAPATLPTGERRGFLADGDEVTLRAYCSRDGFARIGFGSCSVRVLSASGGSPGSQAR